MKRRELLAGLAAGGMDLEAEPQEQGSLYIPKPHLVEDREFMHGFMDEFAFADLVTADPTLRITHIPVLLVREAGPYGSIFGHVSRQNPQRAAFASQQSAVIVFHGPHSYISPSWYGKAEAVPTWNFAVVHATGRLKPISDKKALREVLAKLIGKFEDRETSSYEFARLPESYKDGMIGGIVGFELKIELLEGKFKLGQERSAADRERTLEKLGAAKAERPMSEFTAEFYRRSKPQGS